MKRLFLVTGVLFILILAATYQNNSNVNLIISNLIYRTGEFKSGNLRYGISLFNVIPVGDAVFYEKKEEEFQGKVVYHLEASAKTSSFVSRFFKASAILDSFVQSTDRNPVEFRQKILVSGKADIIKTINYDQTRHIMSISGVQREILLDTQDPLSAMFNLKNMDFEKNREIEININTNQKNYVLEGKASPREIVIDGKKYKLYILNAQVRRREKNPYHRSSLSVVFLKDKENIPILIKVFSSGMLINVRLVEVK